MFTHIFETLKSEAFWTAVGSLVALISLVIPVFFFARHRSLQRILDHERRFYETVPRGQVSQELQTNSIHAYMDAVDRSLVGLERLPSAARQAASQKLRDLLANLRATHESLVKAIQPFALTSAKTFLDGFDQFQAEFSSLYHAGRIPSDARTHCHDVERVVSDLSALISFDTPGWQDIQALRSSVVIYDREVIVPIMVSILERAQLEIAMIAHCLRDGDKRKAIWLKERYWFDVKPLYQSVTATLGKMSSLANQL